MIPAFKMGSDESRFNVSVGSDGQSHKSVSTNHNLFEEKGEPKRCGTEVLPLTNPRFTARPNPAAHLLACFERFIYTAELATSSCATDVCSERNFLYCCLCDEFLCN